MIWSFPSTLKCKLGVACVASSGLAGGVIMNRSSELDVSAHPPKSEEFVTGSIWHPIVDFERSCVRVCKGTGLDGNSFSKARVQVHLLKVDSGEKSVTCQVHHLSEAVP